GNPLSSSSLPRPDVEVVKRTSSYTDHNLGLTNLRLGDVFIAEFVGTAELAEEDRLHFLSKLFANNDLIKLQTMPHLVSRHLFRTDLQRTSILEKSVGLIPHEQ